MQWWKCSKSMEQTTHELKKLYHNSCLVDSTMPILKGTLAWSASFQTLHSISRPMVLGILRERPSAFRLCCHPQLFTKAGATIEPPLTPIIARPARVTSNIGLLLSQCSLKEHAREVLRNLSGWNILGLDVNTHSTGFAVLQGPEDPLNHRCELIDWGRVCTKSTTDILDGGRVLEGALRNLSQKWSKNMRGEEWRVGIEEFAMSYTAGRFNTRSLFKLAQISGIVKFSCLQIFGSKPYAWHPTSARAYYGLRKEGCRKGSNNVKQVVFDFANERESPAYFSYNWEITSDGEPLKTNFDVTDAYLMAVYTWVRLMMDRIGADKVLRENFHNAYVSANAEKLVKKENQIIEEAEKLVEGEKEKKSKARGARRIHLNELRRKTDKLFDEAIEAWARESFP